MMHKLLPAIAAFLFILPVGGCGAGDSAGRLPLSLPPFTDGEVNRYRIVATRGTADSAPVVLGELAAGLALDWLDRAPVYRLGLVSRTRTGDLETVDSSSVVMHQSDLRPIASFRSIAAGPALVTTTAEYGRGSVAISTRLPAGQEQHLLPTVPGTYDADQLTLLGRALRPGPNRPVTITVAEPMGAAGSAVRTGAFRALGDETVAVPAGTTSCRKLGLTLGDSKMELWYEKTGTGRLVRQFSLETGVAIELMPPEPAGIAPTDSRP